MPNWKETNEIRTQAVVRDVRMAIETINNEMLKLPPRFKLTANSEGRMLTLLATDEPKEG